MSRGTNATTDLFSAQAAGYARYRPRYPAALFEYLAGLAPGRRVAWDCGTGNGQAALGLAAHFERIIATDASAAQIAHATPHPRIEYRVARAEDAALEVGGVDLVTVAQALHWLPFEAFYANVRRSLRPAGILAVWCYSPPRVSDAVDAVCGRFYRDVVGPCWAPGRRWIEERYETIPFPFDETRPTPGFECRQDWTLVEYVGYLETWSAVQRYRQQRGQDPMAEIHDELSSAWGPAEVRRTVTWPVHLRVGRTE